MEDFDPFESFGPDVPEGYDEDLRGDEPQPHAPDEQRHHDVTDLAAARLPSELDLMARIAGLQLLHRWGGWRQEPFTIDSRRYVSVYGRRRH
jgi:hypothetical protein